MSWYQGELKAFLISSIAIFTGLVLVYDLRAGDAVKNRIAAHASSVAALAGRPLTASSVSHDSLLVRWRSVMDTLILV